MVKSASYAPAHRSMANPSVAVFLLRVRMMQALTQQQAAKLSGISVRMLSMLENGKRRPSVVTTEQTPTHTRSRRTRGRC